MSSGPESGATECLSCGAAISGSYCAACGEKRVGSHDLQLGHLAHEFWHEVTHLDGKIWRSFRALLFQPGLLTEEYWVGRHGRWMRPLRIFLIVTALSLLLVPEAAGPLGMKLYVVRDGATTRISVGQRPTGALTERGVADGSVRLDTVLPDETMARLNEKINKYHKILQYLGLAVFAGFSLLLLRRAQPYYGGHLIWALHFYSFEYVITGVANKLNANPVFGWLLTLLYLTIGMHRLGGGAWWAIVLRAVVLCGVVAISELLVMAAAGRLAWWFH